MYLWIFDDDKKRAAADKIAGGCAIYERRYGVRPTLVLVNEADKDAPPPQGVTVRSKIHILPNNYWVGQDT
ncbi:MAG TPA: hypothetical protein VFT99_11090 [Roseiflexaceae bacterium]|nr:hypothetical protein [Roseiflexaceae bacterium]